MDEKEAEGFDFQGSAGSGRFDAEANAFVGREWRVALAPEEGREFLDFFEDGDVLTALDVFRGERAIQEGFWFGSRR